jgi:molybdate transport system substrate-binding protein
MKRAAMIAATLAACTIWSGAMAQELTVIGGGGAAPAADALIPGFEKETGAKVKIAYTSGGALAGRVLKGEQYDVGLIPTESLKQLVDGKKVDESTRAHFAEAKFAFAVKKGAPPVRAATLELFQQLLTDAKSVAWPDPKNGASVGIMFQKAIDMWTPSWGIGEDLAKKTILTKELSDIAGLLKSGKAQYGVLLTTQIAADPELEVASLMPAELQLVNVYVAYVMAGAKQPELAKKFVAYLTTPAAAEVVRAKGFEQKK